MRMPSWWQTALVWGLGTAAVAFFGAYLIMLHADGPRAERWRNALAAGAVVAALAAGIVQVSAMVRAAGRDGARGAAAAVQGKYNPTSTAVVLS